MGNDKYAFHHKFTKVSWAVKFYLANCRSNDQINLIFSSKDYPYNIELW